MKIAILSQSNGRGGAFAAAYRLHESLLRVGSESTMIVNEKTRGDDTVIGDNIAIAKGWRKVAITLDRLPLKFYRDRDRSMFSLQWFPDQNASKIARVNPDVIQLNWICQNHLAVETIAQLNKPMVWTLSDMWPFTGGCHYSQDCNHYLNSCGACPLLHSSKNCDLSRWGWQRKAKAWENLDLTVVTPSSWLAECAKSSSLFKRRRVEVIPWGLDIQKYQPKERRIARELLGLPQNKLLVLFGATHIGETRKGFHLLLPALQSLVESGWQDKIELVVFGISQPDNPVGFGFKSHYTGQLHDDISIALIYSAADVMVVSSIQEAFGQTASESLACGTPVVAFDKTGVADIIDHQQNGYLARPFQIEDLARGIVWVLSDRDRHQKLRLSAREKAEREFNLELMAHRYLSIFSEILEKKNKKIYK